MLKKLFIIAFMTLASSTAFAHNTCPLQTVWRPGYWKVYYEGTHYEQSVWQEGFWVSKRVCPPPPLVVPRPVITVRVPPVFPQVRIHRHHHHRRTTPHHHRRR